jgi:hypothetical protein
MVLLQPVVEILAVAMPHTCARGRPDRAGIAVVPVRGDPIGRDAGGHIAVLAEHHVDQRTRSDRRHDGDNATARGP